VAATSPDIKAEVIAASVAERADMQLLADRVLPTSEIEDALNAGPSSGRRALVLVGRPVETSKLAQHFLAQCPDLVVLQVDVIGDIVHIGLRDPRLEALLDTLRDLAGRIGIQARERTARVQLETDRPSNAVSAAELAAHNRLLQAAFDWIKAVLRDAVQRIGDDNCELHGFSLTRATLLQSLDSESATYFADSVRDAALKQTLREAARTNEPLAVIAGVFQLTFLEFKLLLLSLAPELDNRFQRCIGFLLDDMSRRTGTFGLYCSLLGVAPNVCTRLARNTLVRWLAFENRVFWADEPLRLDPHLAQWILGDSDALARDVRVRRALRLSPWLGAGILTRSEDCETGAKAWERFRSLEGARWLVLVCDDPADWRAILELGAVDGKVTPIRVEPSRLEGHDAADLEDCAVRLGRIARLTGNPLVFDVTSCAGADEVGERIAFLLAVLDRIGCRGIILGRDRTKIVRQLRSAPFENINEAPISSAGRSAAVCAAADGADAFLTAESAEGISRRYPLSIDALEQAMRLAVSRPTDDRFDDSRVRRFTEACRELAVEGLSQLAERIEPVFRVEDIVLLDDRKRQLLEIIDHVRLAPKVLDGWRFREQLPYGRGVSALFFGPSGTGKTMAAMGIAHALGVQLLRVDLSRVVSKYIGDTEKNIDRVFNDAQKSGSAILIDEADALLGRRSEVKDAHDRYANIEVAYVLQRMEAYEGLAILTSNMRQNLDPAFLRRLRFIVDFPRPDATAREQIWRFCLPEESHALDDAAFRQLARKIDLTGGHIRQITLRAAFLAAAADVRIDLAHIAVAARAEFAKLGLPPAEIDLNGRRAA